jgi:hypothetical protein
MSTLPSSSLSCSLPESVLLPSGSVEAEGERSTTGGEEEEDRFRCKDG